jgi:hypothetical protein
MTSSTQKPSRAQYINKIWAARIQLEKKETIIIGNRPVKAVAWSALDLLCEAMRVDGYIPHVKNPQPPRILYAASDEIQKNPLKVADLADEWAQSVKAVTGRAYQRNSPVMAGIVFSLPKEMVDEWPAFRDASIRWMRKKYGERLKLVIEHEDEENPHCHAYLLSNFGVNAEGKPFSESFGAVHEGYAESRSARRKAIEKLGNNAVAKNGKGYTKGANTRSAFKDAMKDYQDIFYYDVARHFNLTRLGPQVKKLNHAEAIRQRNIKKAETERLEAEELRLKAFEEVRAAMEARRLVNLDIDQQRVAARENAEMISAKVIEDALERAKVEGQRIIKGAKLAAEDKENTIRALIENDERVAVRMLKENIKLKEDFLLLHRAFAKAEKEIEHWRGKFYSAYSWLQDAVRRLEFLGDFGLSKIFTNQLGKTAAKRVDR